MKDISKSPDEWVKQAYSKLTIQDKVTFIAALLFGLLAHGYMLTNKLPNYDDIQCLTDDYGAGLEFGRWFLFIIGNVVRKTIGNYSIPWFNGIVCILLLALTAVLIGRILNLKNLIFSMLLGGVLVSFPAVTCTLFFMYTATYYCLSVLLATLSVYIVKKAVSWKAYIGGMLVLACSIGIYQAYFTFAAALFVSILVFQSGDSDSGWRNTTIHAIRYFVVLIGSFILYMILLKICLPIKGITELTGYQGINEMGRMTFQHFVETVKMTYVYYFKMLSGNCWNMNPYIHIKIIASICEIVIGLYQLKLAIIRFRRREWTEGLLCVVILLLFPVSINSILIISGKASVYSIMVMTVVQIYIITLAIVDKSNFKAGQWILGSLMLVIVISQCQYANVEYLAMQLDFEEAQSYYSNMVTQIKSVNGYYDEMPIVVIGDTIEDKSLYNNKELSGYETAGRNVLVNAYSWKKFLRYYINYDPVYVNDVSEWETRERVQEMPCYPDAGSIEVIGDCVVLKLK